MGYPSTQMFPRRKRSRLVAGLLAMLFCSYMLPGTVFTCVGSHGVQPASHRCDCSTCKSRVEDENQCASDCCLESKLARKAQIAASSDSPTHEVHAQLDAGECCQHFAIKSSATQQQSFSTVQPGLL